MFYEKFAKRDGDLVRVLHVFLFFHGKMFSPIPKELDSMEKNNRIYHQITHLFFPPSYKN